MYEVTPLMARTIADWWTRFFNLPSDTPDPAIQRDAQYVENAKDAQTLSMLNAVLMVSRKPQGDSMVNANAVRAFRETFLTLLVTEWDGYQIVSDNLNYSPVLQKALDTVNMPHHLQMMIPLKVIMRNDGNTITANVAGKRETIWPLAQTEGAPVL